jgi:RHS repeat-associated protein
MHYDPWGLNLVGIEVKGSPEDLYQFNAGSEKSYSLIDKSYLYETDWRFYDPQSGRFWGVDALADDFVGISPMQFGYNNPLSFNDPTGLFAGPGDKVFGFGQLGHMHSNAFNWGGLAQAGIGIAFNLATPPQSKLPSTNVPSSLQLSASSVKRSFQDFQMGEDLLNGMMPLPNGYIERKKIGNQGITSIYDMLNPLPISDVAVPAEQAYNGQYKAAAASVITGAVFYFTLKGSKRPKPDKYTIGLHDELTNWIKESGSDLTSHHVGQGVVMQEVLGQQYIYIKGLAIAVPKAGHTKIGPNGRLRTTTTNQVIKLAREMGWDLTTIEGKRSVLRYYLARDIRELRKVYPDISNSTLKELINLNYAFNPIMLKPK